MSTYLTLKQKHQAEVDAFPMAFAFSNRQFEEAMEKLGLKATDTDKIYSIGGGGIIRRTDSKALSEMFARHAAEVADAINADETGDGYIFEMFDYELGNHEYNYTGDVEPTLETLDLTIDEVNENPKLRHGLNKAIKAQREIE